MKQKSEVNKQALTKKEMETRNYRDWFDESAQKQIYELKIGEKIKWENEKRKKTM